MNSNLAHSYVRYGSLNQTYGDHLLQRQYRRAKLESCKSLYRKDLFGHFGCVNAVEFSKDGNWLSSVANQNQGVVGLNSTARNLNNQLFRASASFYNKIKTKGLILPCCEDQIPLSKEFTDMPTGSLCMILIPSSCLQNVSEVAITVKGGDDRRVLLWNVEKAMHGSKHSTQVMKAEHMSNIFCTVFDNSVEHVFSSGNDEQVIRHNINSGEAVGFFNHEEPVYCVAIPSDDCNLFSTAGEDGCVLVWDIRSPQDHVSLAISSGSFHGVTFNPVETRLIVTANAHDGVMLFDLRYPERSAAARVNSSLVKVILFKYGLPSRRESAMSVRFDQTGTKIFSLLRRTGPVLYKLNERRPIVQFKQEGYSNVCTMKSACFAGDADQYVVSGSDDFNVYVWKVPQQNSFERVVKEAFLILKGHRSIVNQVRCNPKSDILATAGVEKIIKLWSPFPLPGSSGGIEGSKEFVKRPFYSHEQYMRFVLDSGQPLNHDYDSQSTDEDPRMIAFFDSLIQRVNAGWDSDDSSEESSMDGIFQLIMQEPNSDSDSGRSENESEGGPFARLTLPQLRRIYRLNRRILMNEWNQVNDETSSDNESNDDEISRNYYAAHRRRAVLELQEIFGTPDGDTNRTEVTNQMSEINQLSGQVCDENLESARALLAISESENQPSLEISQTNTRDLLTIYDNLNDVCNEISEHSCVSVTPAAENNLINVNSQAQRANEPSCLDLNDQKKTIMKHNDASSSFMNGKNSVETSRVLPATYQSMQYSGETLETSSFSSLSSINNQIKDPVDHKEEVNSVINGKNPAELPRPLIVMNPSDKCTLEITETSSASYSLVHNTTRSDTTDITNSIINGNCALTISAGSPGIHSSVNNREYSIDIDESTPSQSFHLPSNVRRETLRNRSSTETNDGTDDDNSTNSMNPSGITQPTVFRRLSSHRHRKYRGHTNHSDR